VTTVVDIQYSSAALSMRWWLHYSDPG